VEHTRRRCVCMYDEGDGVSTCVENSGVCGEWERERGC
jgi:hypothetical protein